jgi:hypothetical protein
MCIDIYEVQNEHGPNVDNGRLCHVSFLFFVAFVNNRKISSGFYCYISYRYCDYCT